MDGKCVFHGKKKIPSGEYSQQIKPVFDIDAYDAKPDINSIIADINKIFPDKPVKYAEREPREFKGAFNILIVSMFSMFA